MPKKPLLSKYIDLHQLDTLKKTMEIQFHGINSFSKFSAISFIYYVQIITVINIIWFVFTSSCLQEGACLIYVICVRLHIVWSNTYCVVLLFCFSSSCVPYVASFSGLSFFDCPFGFLLRLFKHNRGRYLLICSCPKVVKVTFL